MRIVHQFYGQAQVAGFGSHYNTKITEPPPDFPGFQAELMAVDMNDRKEGEGDALYLEGDGKAIRLMLQGLLRLLNEVEKSAREQWAEKKATIALCSRCKKWVPKSHDKKSCDSYKKVK